MKSNRVTDLVQQFVQLDEARDALMKEAEKAGYPPAALQRAARSTPAKVMKQQERAAVDHQIRYLAGQESERATIPPESDLWKVAELAARKMSARDIAKKLGFGKSKAGKLMQQGHLFGVRTEADADSAIDD